MTRAQRRRSCRWAQAQARLPFRLSVCLHHTLKPWSPPAGGRGCCALCLTRCARPRSAPSLLPQANHLAALRRAAAAEAAGDTAARRLTLEWMCAPPTDEEAQNVSRGAAWAGARGVL